MALARCRSPLAASRRSRSDAAGVGPCLRPRLPPSAPRALPSPARPTPRPSPGASRPLLRHAAPDLTLPAPVPACAAARLLPAPWALPSPARPTPRPVPTAGRPLVRHAVTARTTAGLPASASRRARVLSAPYARLGLRPPSVTCAHCHAPSPPVDRFCTPIDKTLAPPLFGRICTQNVLSSQEYPVKLLH